MEKNVKPLTDSEISYYRDCAERALTVGVNEEDHLFIQDCEGGGRMLATIEALEERADDLATELNRVIGMLERAMDHGLNGSRYYHALKAGDLGDEIKAYLSKRAALKTGEQAL